MALQNDTSIPIWQNDHIYKGFQDPLIASHCLKLEEYTQEIFSTLQSVG